MTLPWYPRDMGKYARDTKKLSLVEHGAYNLLLDHYYSNGPEQCSSNAHGTAQLMPDHSRFYRICSATNRDEQRAVDYILETYFVLIDGFYRNERCDQVIEKQLKKHKTRVRVGKENRAKALLKHCSSNAPQTQTKNQRKTPPLPPSPGGMEPSNEGKGGEGKTRHFTQDRQPAASGGVPGTSGPRPPQNALTAQIFDIQHFLKDSDRQKAKEVAPGWDLNGWLIPEFNDRVRSGAFEVPKNPAPAFIAWAKNFTKGKQPT